MSLTWVPFVMSCSRMFIGHSNFVFPVRGPHANFGAFTVSFYLSTLFQTCGVGYDLCDLTEVNEPSPGSSSNLPIQYTFDGRHGKILFTKWDVGEQPGTPACRQGRACGRSRLQIEKRRSKCKGSAGTLDRSQSTDAYNLPY